MQLLQQLVAGYRLQAVAVIEIAPDHLLDLGDIALRDPAQRRQDRQDRLVSELVEDELAVPSRGDNPGASHLLQML